MIAIQKITTAAQSSAARGAVVRFCRAPDERIGNYGQADQAIDRTHRLEVPRTGAGGDHALPMGGVSSSLPTRRWKRDSGPAMLESGYTRLRRSTKTGRTVSQTIAMGM